MLLTKPLSLSVPDDDTCNGVPVPTRGGGGGATVDRRIAAVVSRQYPPSPSCRLLAPPHTAAYVSIPVVCLVLAPPHSAYGSIRQHCSPSVGAHTLRLPPASCLLGKEV